MLAPGIAAVFTVLLGMPEAAPAPETGLRLDHMPTVLFNDDITNVHLQVMVELKEDDRFKVEALSTTGGFLWQRSIDPDESGVIRLVIAPGERTDMSACRLHLLREKQPVYSFQFRILRAVEGLPPLNAAGSRLYDENGVRCLVIAEHRVRHHGRTWLPFRAVHGLVTQKPRPTGSYVLSDLPLTPVEDRKIRFIPCGPGETSSRPIFEAIAASSRMKAVRLKESVTLFVGSRDIQVGTPPRELRIGLESLLQHLQRRGAEDLRLVMPVASQQYRERLEVHRKQFLKVAEIYRINRVITVEGRFPSDIWREGWLSSTFRRSPSSEALEKIAKFLGADSRKGY